jgi:hypothetical protein
MEKSDRRPFKRFLDRSNNIHFKVVSTNNGLFNLYEGANFTRDNGDTNQHCQQQLAQLHKLPVHPKKKTK